MSTLWFGYFWPSLKGNGPEALVQTIVYGLIAVAVWPPARDALKRYYKHENEHLHQKLDHIIKHHPSIPDFHPKETK